MSTKPEQLPPLLAQRISLPKLATAIETSSEMWLDCAAHSSCILWSSAPGCSSAPAQPHQGVIPSSYFWEEKLVPIFLGNEAA